MARLVREMGSALARGADRAAAAVASALLVPSTFLGWVIETSGNSIAALAEAAAGWAGKGSGVRFVLHWLSTLISAAFQLVAMTLRAVIDMAGGVAAGLIRIVVGGVGGLLAWDRAVPVRGVGDVAAGVGGAAIAIFASSLAVVQAALFMQLGERPLTDEERDLLHKVYRGSLALDNVRIVDGSAGAFNLLRKFTLGNRIYMKGDLAKGDWAKQWPDVLVHEACHVWQNQNEGTRYIADALWAQWSYQLAGKNAYDWKAELAAGKARWPDLNKEAQAEFLRDVWRYGTVAEAGQARGAFFADDPELAGAGFGGLTEFAKASVAHVRSGGKGRA